MADDSEKILTTLAEISITLSNVKKDVSTLSETTAASIKALSLDLKALTKATQADHTQLQVLVSELHRTTDDVNQFKELTTAWDTRFHSLEGDVGKLQQTTSRWIGKLIGIGLAIAASAGIVAALVSKL